MEHILETRFRRPAPPWGLKANVCKLDQWLWQTFFSLSLLKLCWESKKDDKQNLVSVIMFIKLLVKGQLVVTCCHLSSSESLTTWALRCWSLPKNLRWSLELSAEGVDDFLTATDAVATSKVIKICILSTIKFCRNDAHYCLFKELSFCFETSHDLLIIFFLHTGRSITKSHRN